MTRRRKKLLVAVALVILAAVVALTDLGDTAGCPPGSGQEAVLTGPRVGLALPTAPDML